MADGSIRVNTGLNLTGIKKDIKEFEKEIAKAEKEVEALEKKKAKETSKYEKDAENGVGSTKDEAIEKQAQIVEEINKKMEEASARAEQYKKKLAEATAEFQKQQSLSDANKQLNQAIADNKFADGIKSQEEYNSILAETERKMAQIEAEAERIATMTGTNKNELLAQNQTYQKLADQHRILTDRTYEFENASASAGATASASMSRATAASTQFGMSVQNCIKRLKLMAMAVFGARGAYMMLRQAVMTYMQSNEELYAQVQTLKQVFAQTIGPVIEWVISLIIKAISYVNAFVSALTGINIVAKANAAALKKQSQASKSGNQSASFDEQTKLSATSQSGSGASGTLPDGTNIDLTFLDPLKKALEDFWADVEPLLNTLKTLGKWIYDDILVPVADWAANSVLPAVLGVLGEAFLILNDALILCEPIFKWIWEEILKPIAEWTGGKIVEIITAIGDWCEEHHETLSKVAAVVLTIVGAILLVKGAILLLSGVMAILTSPITWIILAIAGLIALFVELYDNCEGFRKGVDEAWQGIKDIFKGAIDFIKGLFSGDEDLMAEGFSAMCDGGQRLFDGLWEGLQAGWEWLKVKVPELWQKFVDKFKEFFGIHSPSTLFADFGKYMMDGLYNGLVNAINKIQDACKKVWEAIKGCFSKVGDWFKDTFSKAWQKVKDIFSTGSKIFSGIKEGIADTFKSIVNKIIDGINTIIATPFNKINGLLNTIRSISVAGFTPFKNLWSYNPLSVPKIPKLAKGGIVNNIGKGVPLIAGEAGREAILPLENNTEWMDVLVDKINGGNTTVPIYLDGKMIAKYIIDLQKRRAFATNGG